ncbi:MAG: hypothetical protein ACI8VC_001755 [Candidatus Endobugula sp.]|jgi:hypothetical protein
MLGRDAGPSCRTVMLGRDAGPSCRTRSGIRYPVLFGRRRYGLSLIPMRLTGQQASEQLLGDCKFFKTRICYEI